MHVHMGEQFCLWPSPKFTKQHNQGGCYQDLSRPRSQLARNQQNCPYNCQIAVLPPAKTQTFFTSLFNVHKRLQTLKQCIKVFNERLVDVCEV